MKSYVTQNPLCIFCAQSVPVNLQFPGIFELRASTKENINIGRFSAKYD